MKQRAAPRKADRAALEDSPRTSGGAGDLRRPPREAASAKKTAGDAVKAVPVPRSPAAARSLPPGPVPRPAARRLTGPSALQSRRLASMGAAAPEGAAGGRSVAARSARARPRLRGSDLRRERQPLCCSGRIVVLSKREPGVKQQGCQKHPRACRN